MRYLWADVTSQKFGVVENEEQARINSIFSGCSPDTDLVITPFKGRTPVTWNGVLSRVGGTQENKGEIALSELFSLFKKPVDMNTKVETFAEILLELGWKRHCGLQDYCRDRVASHYGVKDSSLKNEHSIFGSILMCTGEEGEIRPTVDIYKNRIVISSQPDREDIRLPHEALSKEVLAFVITLHKNPSNFSIIKEMTKHHTL